MPIMFDTSIKTCRDKALILRYKFMYILCRAKVFSCIYTEYCKSLMHQEGKKKKRLGILYLLPRYLPFSWGITFSSDKTDPKYGLRVTSLFALLLRNNSTCSFNFSSHDVFVGFSQDQSQVPYNIQSFI